MTVRFLTSVADATMGSFIEGRVITIDPSSSSFNTFRQWLKAGIIAPVRTGEPVRPSTALERTVSIPAPSRSRGSGRKARLSASAADPASPPKM